MITPLLSVVVISHNQKEVLKRCIDSILAQITTFQVEVIVSDDRSTDGTREMLQKEYEGKVIATFFNSDEYVTSYVLERAALNRINGLKKATGKYLIHIDGDDYFTSTDLFQTMVDRLEEHPECNVCCQNYYSRPYNDLNSEKKPAKPVKLFSDERILSGAAFLKAEAGIRHNSCFCLRRSDCVKIEHLTSNSYDDIDITLRYLGNGKVLLLNRCDFVYVQYTDSSCSTITKDEKMIVFQSEILDIPLVPSLAGVIIESHLSSLARMSIVVLKSRRLPRRLIDYCHKFNMLMLSDLQEKMSFLQKMRYSKILFWSLCALKIPVGRKRLVRKLYQLAVQEEIPSNVII